jgi:dipeptidyl aminopeptidase/acylaminoacyl peptidase
MLNSIFKTTMRTTHYSCCFVFFCCLLSTAAFLANPSHLPAQTDTLRSLDHSDYDLWTSLSSQQISNDGKWISFSTKSGKSKAQPTLFIRQNRATKEYSIPRGSGAKFTFDSKFVIYRITPDPEKIASLKKAKVPADQIPGTIIEIMNLGTGKRTSIDRVSSFKIPDENSDWIAYLRTKPIDRKSVKQQVSKVVESYEVTGTGLKKPTRKQALKKRPADPLVTPPVKNKTKPASVKKPAVKKPKTAEVENKNNKKKNPGTTLVLHDLRTGTQQTFPNVVQFRFDKKGTMLAYSTSVESAGSSQSPQAKSNKNGSKTKPVGDGLFLVNLKSLESQVLLEGKGEYKQLAFSDAGNQVAFLTNRDDYKSKTPRWAVFHWKSGQKMATKVATESSVGLPVGWWISSSTNPTFSENGQRLFFDTAPVPEAVLKERKGMAKSKDGESAKPEPEKAKLDVWHWQDPLLQPQQLLQAERERRRNYRAVYNIKSKKLIQLATLKVPDVRIDPRSPSRLVVGSSNMPYRKMLSWDIPGFQDTYLINLDTGVVETIIEKSKFSATLSPDGQFVTWFDAEARKWYAISTGKDREPVEISKGIPYPLQNELHDTPSLARAYGAAGWLEHDAGLLIYDRYDIWLVDPTGKDAPVCITDNLGREEKIRFRYQRLDRELRAISPEQSVLLSAFDDETKASGFYQLTLTAPSSGEAKTSGESISPKLKRLMMLDERVSGLSKSKNTNDVIFSRSTFRRCPDLWSSTTAFKKIYRISDINPQQENYRWGSAELVHWNATDGQPLDGILIKPDGFDPNKKYPMMVYFYERNSDNLHSYYTPAAGRSIINHSFYVSRGYVVFIPDIPYKTGEPGPSAANAVLPGVESIVKQGFINPKKIGMQGHSWGGYQTAYLVTQTDMFACAESGAPVSNMTSAYGGIRWSSGMSRMFQYERTQSRIGADLWSARDKYIANSPVFFADKINTPLLILHNDQDGAVPWYQGIELFVALRRLEQPAWLLNYNGDPHWVMKDANRKDFAIRMQQFFDFYLMDAPEPEWMAYGVPGVDKGKKFGLELMEPKAQPKQETK